MGSLAGYKYRKKITIEGTADGAQTNYQMRLAVHKYYAPFADNGVAEPTRHSIVPMAYYYNGKTYVVWQGTSLDPYIDAYTHATGTWAGAVKVGTNPLSGGSHGTPSVIVDNSGYIHVFYGCHGATGVKYAKSTNTEDISAWTAQDDIGTVSTYPKVIKDSSGVLWLFTREEIGDQSLEYYWKSTDWETKYEIIDPEDSDDRICAGNPAYDSTNERVHIVWTHFDNSAGINVNVYHAYLNLGDGHMYDMAGTDLGTTITFAEAESNCKIVSYTDEWVTYYPVVHLDENNYPHVIYSRQISSNYHAYHLAWNGSSWDAEVEIDDGLISGAHDFYITASDDIDAYFCLGSRNLVKWHWNGSTWSETTILSSAAFQTDIIRSTYCVLNGVAGLRLIVSKHDTDDFTNDDLDVYALDSSDNLVHPNNRIGLEGHCLDDFGDIRFTKSDGTTELDYWLESQVATDDAVFWIEFDAIPADPSTGTFYIYYGKGDAVTTSSPTNTLVAYEDFEDAGTWADDLVDIGTPVKTRDTVFYKIGTASLKLEDDDNAAYEGIYIPHASGNKRRYVFYAAAHQTNNNIYLAPYYETSAVILPSFANTGNIRYIDNTTTKDAQAYIADTWYKFELRAHTADHLWDLYIDDVLIQADIDTYSQRTYALTRFYTRSITAADMPTWWLDHLLIFNWTPNEPTWGAWGSEELTFIPRNIGII